MLLACLGDAHAAPSRTLSSRSATRSLLLICGPRAPLAAMAANAAGKAVEAQLVALGSLPGTPDEQVAARRALVRYGRQDDTLSASEDWVR
eukprot:247966-Alexandrium_andersonii.AAC.1